MPSVQIRDVPEPLISRLRTEAKKQHRSLAQQALVLLANSLNVELDPAQRRQRVVTTVAAEIRAAAAGCELPDPGTLVREDRAR